jgi:hypothetical protein
MNLTIHPSQAVSLHGGGARDGTGGTSGSVNAEATAGMLPPLVDLLKHNRQVRARGLLFLLAWNLNILAAYIICFAHMPLLYFYLLHNIHWPYSTSNCSCPDSAFYTG